MKPRLFFYSIFAVLLLSGLLISFWSPTDNKRKSELLQGGLSQETVSRQEHSLFDSSSGFVDFSGTTEERSTDPNEPKIPDEKKSYLDKLSDEDRAKLYEQMYERFKPLADRFPDNRLIPRKISSEEAAKRKEEEDHYYRIQSDLLDRKEVSKEDMNFFLDTKLKRSDDMLEILKYSIENFEKSSKSDGSPNGEYGKIVRERIENIEKSREEVLASKKSNEN
ncbi:hypothetical protein LEP1GSC050_0487 [Leptospira broomii serovar Hurstbridge str. 5399]|uniref:Uncharacterized protein n=1 Tax=Leptospira broomii serovar Hurstbridge str. 5399 TaxID=1049789 RepID=T0GLJ3_9LEPT|nr:hypothetical protein [Leptospira broomii]EQA46238.1 hypothetical protein LEP1GSC050_0487 [Leptospira broomii serovar Hurstbridge str. 5399]